MKINILKLFSPSNLSITATTGSLIAWIIPGIGGIKKGYDTASEITITSFLMIFSWYSLVYFSGKFGELVGKKIYQLKFLKLNIPQLDNKYIIRTFTILAAAGLFETYRQIFSTLSPLEAFIYISSGMANELKEALYQEYSPGILSLRYLVIYSASLSIYNYVVSKKINYLLVINFFLLILSSLLSSRLIFVATLILSFFLLASKNRFISFNFIKLIIVAAVLFVILSAFNYSRNSNYYKADDLNFFGGGLSSIMTYLGSPFQVAVGSANNIERVVSEEIDGYRNFVDIDITLNTNSAFVHLHESMGYWAWPYTLLLFLFFGLLFGHMKSYGLSTFLLPCGSILYASSEFWRLNLFSQGIFLVWISFGILVPIIIGLITPKLGSEKINHDNSLHFR